LISKGYSLPKYGADGDFGSEMYNAVIKFQKANGLTADGIVGPATWAALLSTTGSTTTTTTSSNTTTTISTSTKIKASAVIAIAENEVGYLEKATNSQLDDKAANAGYNNYTKYARDIDENYPNFYNGKKNGFAWCDVFVDWCFIQAFGETTALKLLCAPQKSAGAGCPYSANYFRANNQFYKSPKVGD
jgi:peptidoglycan hydrolase-like protein with peptidoglycan-binding domain